LKQLIILDFDGVLFDSLFEVYEVCQNVASTSSKFRQDVGFEEFLAFRKHLVDAWQFNRLYSKECLISDFKDLLHSQRNEQDIEFAEKFFLTRKEMMEDSQWAALLSPYLFFNEIKKDLHRFQHVFKILSMRNEYSIRRALDFYSAPKLEIAGQELIEMHGSKLDVATHLGWLSPEVSSIYIDDMPQHIEQLEEKVDLAVHADWGYGDGSKSLNSCSQVFSIKLVKLILEHQLP